MFPIAVGFSICTFSYILSNFYKLDKIDKILGCISGVGIGLLLYLRNVFNWLPLPNGSYINTKEIGSTAKRTDPYVEPLSYVSEFYYSIVSKFLSVAIGILIIAGGIYFFSKTSIIFPALLIAGGIFILYSGLKELRDTSPKIKLAESGLWTKQLGFKPWTTISKTEIKTERGYRTTQIYLEIYLRDSKNNYPNQRLLLNDIKNYKKIKPKIDELYNA